MVLENLTSLQGHEITKDGWQEKIADIHNSFKFKRLEGDRSDIKRRSVVFSDSRRHLSFNKHIHYDVKTLQSFWLCTDAEPLL